MLQARAIMKKDVLTVTPDETLEKVIRILVQHNVTGLPVVNPDMTLAGIITEKDVLRFLSGKCVAELAAQTALSQTPVRKVMSGDVVSFSQDTDIQQIWDCLVKSSFRRVPVTDSEGKLVGIISRKDIIAVIA